MALSFPFLLLPSGVCLLLLALIRFGRLWHRKSRPAGPKLRVAFLHPDLGIGGAERLVVDAALALQNDGMSVSIVTAHHDPMRCFEETRDGTLAVRISGSWVPRHMFGKLHIVCATLRSLVGGACLLVLEPNIDAVVVDQVPAAVPLLRMCGVPVLFYCHFPDKLLATPGIGGGGLVKRALRRAYRLPFDMLEEVCTGCASRVLVNSHYTASVYAESFALLRALRCSEPGVLHPAIDLETNMPLPWPTLSSSSTRPLTFVSINRFERKKSLELAIRALGALRGRDLGTGCRIRLVLAGGYDPRLQENADYFSELSGLIDNLGMADQVVLKQNVSDAERRALFADSVAVVYTPSFEHFGIVPLEAMAAGRPVIAVGLGGPCESVVHGESGWLCDPTAEAFATAFAEVVHLQDAGRLEARGRAARERVKGRFSLAVFGERLATHLAEMCR